MKTWSGVVCLRGLRPRTARLSSRRVPACPHARMHAVLPSPVLTWFRTTSCDLTLLGRLLAVVKAVAKITERPAAEGTAGPPIVMAPLLLPTHVQVQLSHGDTALKLNKTHYDKLERRFKLANALAA